MTDSAVPVAAFLASLGFGEKAPSLPLVFQVGDQIIQAGLGSVPDGTPVQRIAVMGASTIDYLSRAVCCAVLQEGVFPVLYQAPYAAYVQEALNPASGLYAFTPELVVIAPHWRDMVLSIPIICSAQEVDAALAPRLELMRTIWALLAGAGAKIIQHRLLAPPHRYRGDAERLAPASPANQVHRLNALLQEAGRGLVTWVDMEALAHEIGSRRFSPAKFYYAAKLEHDQRWLPDYLPPFRGAWRSANARVKKVLVLDLDNTLWGGVIGDDGIEGIVLGSASPAGEGFEDWQRYVKGLGERGVILAVCSKNDPAVAATGFDHPGSVLRRTDFAAFECSWGDKAAGLRRIAQELNVGLDSFVFCDDNPAECDLVRRELPEVAVVCMGSDASGFIDLFDAGHWLDADSYTQEDTARTAAYSARAAAGAERLAATDIGTYLSGLGMKGSLRRPAESDIARVAQLELKTNQFNVTTRRYSEAQVRALLARDDVVVLAFWLTDRFGDHGLTSTLVAFLEGDALRIDSWLMSCRIFSRSAEQFILRGLAGIAASMGAKRLVGEFVATTKNEVVAGLYPSLGFHPGDGAMLARDVAGAGDLVTYVVDAA